MKSSWKISDLVSGQYGAFFQCCRIIGGYRSCDIEFVPRTLA